MSKYSLKLNSWIISFWFILQALRPVLPPKVWCRTQCHQLGNPQSFTFIHCPQREAGDPEKQSQDFITCILSRLLPLEFFSTAVLSEAPRSVCTSMCGVQEGQSVTCMPCTEDMLLQGRTFFAFEGTFYTIELGLVQPEAALAQNMNHIILYTLCYFAITMAQNIAQDWI